MNYSSQLITGLPVAGRDAGQEAWGCGHKGGTGKLQAHNTCTGTHRLDSLHHGNTNSTGPSLPIKIFHSEP